MGGYLLYSDENKPRQDRHHPSFPHIRNGDLIVNPVMSPITARPMDIKDPDLWTS